MIINRIHRYHLKTLTVKEQGKYAALLAKLNTPLVFWLCVFVLLFFYLQKQLAFHFFYIEQKQLFLWSSAYFSSLIIKPAGLVQWLTGFCVQYFIKPYLGALIISALLTTIGILTAGIIKRIDRKANLFILSLLPIVLLLYMHFDMNYSYEGTIAYLLMMLVLYGYFYIGNLLYRIIYVSVFGVLLFWWAGSTAVLFTICVLLWEMANRISRAYIFILPLLLVIILAFFGGYSSWVGGYRLLFLPDGYYTYPLRPGMTIYLSWIIIPVLLLLCRFLRERKPVNQKRKYAELLFQMLFVTVLFWYSINKFTDRSFNLFHELNYYNRTEQWDKIIKRSNGEISNYLYLSLVNMALTEKGELAEKMFSFTQRGIDGLNVPWNRMPYISALQSDVYFSMGHIALAQQMAFEANVSMQNSSVAMIKRLVQTNLIYGAYPVAEKYIDLLMQTKYHKEWAREHRQFLWNDDAIEKDFLLGIKRKCIPYTNSLVKANTLHIELEDIAKQNPLHKASIQYLGALHLLSKNVSFFKNLLETHYGTDVLPTLPKSYQEAILIIWEQEPAYWEHYSVSASVIQRYNEYKNIVLTNRGNTAGLPNLLKRSFGDTYWFYYMFVNKAE